MLYRDFKLDLRYISNLTTSNPRIRSYGKLLSKVQKHLFQFTTVLGFRILYRAGAGAGTVLDHLQSFLRSTYIFELKETLACLLSPNQPEEHQQFRNGKWSSKSCFFQRCLDVELGTSRSQLKSETLKLETKKHLYVFETNVSGLV